MFPDRYEERLAQWAHLRSSTAEDKEFLFAVNQFWMMAPTVNRWLHWQDQQNWPDPWELLNNSAYCDVAKALGIVYTIMLSGRDHLLDNTTIEQITATLDEENVVRVNGGRYVLNWDLHGVTNIDLSDFSAKFIVSTEDLKVKIK
jgi:uncharacterized protein YlzI (FlbEa/FlbD family)